jgi:hypothetical protein
MGLRQYLINANDLYEPDWMFDGKLLAEHQAAK